MVSKARLDLPEPDRPVSTVNVSRGISTSMFLRLCSRAPRMEMFFSMSFQRVDDCECLETGGIRRAPGPGVVGPILGDGDPYPHSRRQLVPLFHGNQLAHHAIDAL